jgi:hypothetical protein
VQSSNELAWDETVRIMERECMEGDWEKNGVRGEDGKLGVRVESAVTFTLKIQLLVRQGLSKEANQCGKLTFAYGSGHCSGGFLP